MNVYDLQRKLYNSIRDFGPNRRSLEKSILLHELTVPACNKIKDVLEECNYEPKLIHVDLIEDIAFPYREIQEVNQRQILSFQ